MILDAGRASQRLSSPRNLALRFSGQFNHYYNPPGAEHKSINRIGGEPHNQLSETEATLVAVLARSKSEPQASIAKEFGISQPAVSQIANKGISTVDEEVVDRVLNQVEDLALNRLVTSLGFITDEKLNKANVKDLSSVAANMSKIHSGLRGNNGNGVPLVTVQIFRPELKSEHNFKTIDV